ncbi:uncharacterized protein AC631_00745 [Debaryomyces fabryi]|uniref:NDT80 domain-containing protein n=1 Tax=Debaryomyces fabryi TaxID=58627 RepID=A0A0V1Q584_9ASCO|nr:uncharacterized protein AC631_00745 [Debaryomyces fabryi]KSA03429.1 hypothetical protein AC631_00745 [Debaryomyces fabryi]CUM53715.1 unnamed protein product [Debaryomyces fabryi]
MGRPKNSKNKVKTKTSSWSSKKPDKQQLKAKPSDKGLENYSGDNNEQYNVFPESFRSNNGTHGVVVKKRKVAPRSGLQFKVGPSFENTTLYRPIFITSTNENVFPFVNARIDRGFENHGGEWIGYKRNYFTLVSCFEFDGVSPETFFTEKFHILNDVGELENISCFALRLVSRCSEDESVVNLIQHTAKRDRGPQYLPPVFPAISGYLPSHSIIKQASNIRNGDKIDQYNRMFYLDTATLQKCMDASILSTYPEGRIATVARYERIQFSTSINYRKSTMVNRHFILKVELLGLLDDGKYAVLASTETQPLVVRGRSPSNYQMARRNLKALNFNNQKEQASGSGSSSSSNADEFQLDDKSKNKYNKEIPLIKTKYNLLDLQKPAKRGRKKKEKLKTDNVEKLHALRTYQNQGIKRELYNLEDEFIDDDLFPPIIQAKQETFDSMFDLFPYQTEFNLNLESPLTPKKHKKSKSKKSKSHEKGIEEYRIGIPTSACRSQGTDNSSFNQVEEDSFVEFQKELSLLQKELKGDYSNDHTLLGLVT